MMFNLTIKKISYQDIKGEKGAFNTKKLFSTQSIIPLSRYIVVRKNTYVNTYLVFFVFVLYFKLIVIE
jgi:hypothetical protein